MRDSKDEPMVLPNDEEPKRVESSETPIDFIESPSEPPPPPPVTRKRRSFFGLLASTLLLPSSSRARSSHGDRVGDQTSGEGRRDLQEPPSIRRAALRELKDRVRSLVATANRRRRRRSRLSLINDRPRAARKRLRPPPRRRSLPKRQSNGAARR
jgi:hypothetical protein